MKNTKHTADFQSGGTEYITRRIQEAVENGTREATVCGKWWIESEIRLPSDFTLILEDCHLCLADGTYTNLFVNEHHDTPLGKTIEGTDKNIRIFGRRDAYIDGGTYNGLSERNHSKDGMPPIWKNNLILFTNVDGFEIRGIHCHNQRWWALSFVYCRNGRICDIDLCASDLAVDSSGRLYHGLRRGAYNEILVKNADGIDIRQGCHDIEIQRVRGFTEDDSVALTGLNWELERTFRVEGLPPDIARITVRDVKTAAFCTNVRLLNQGGIPLHDILVDTVIDVGLSSPHMDRGLYAVRIGDTHLYGDRHATEEETYNVTVRNVYGEGTYGVALAGAIGNLVLENVHTAPDTPMLLDERTVK